MKAHQSFYIIAALFFMHTLTSSGCKKEPSSSVEHSGKIAFWLTTADQRNLLQQQASLVFGNEKNPNPFLDVDETKTFQSIEGFGYTLTGGSAMLIDRLPNAKKDSLLKELFGTEASSIGVSYLRISIGSSDLDSAVFSYDDIAPGQQDVSLSAFSIRPDKSHLIPVLKKILAIQSKIKILGSPWSAPAWMKDNGNSKGGSLKQEYAAVYAKYLVNYIQQMKAEGITIDAITPQNEPLNPNNNPSMYMTSAQQADFIKNYLVPAFQTAGIQTKIILYDHNADKPEYPVAILNDAAAKTFVDGSAFHLYAGDVSALSQVHDAYPDKNIYFTEQWTGSQGTFSGDLKWHMKNVIIGTMRNWSRTALEWNFANDPSFNPHTLGGCTECQGALTIGNDIKRNVSYYIIAHAAKFVPAGSIRIASNIVGNVSNVAFKTPENKIVVIAINDGTADATFNIRYSNKWAPVTLPAGATATFVWQ